MPRSFSRQKFPLVRVLRLGRRKARLRFGPFDSARDLARAGRARKGRCRARGVPLVRASSPVVFGVALHGAGMKASKSGSPIAQMRPRKNFEDSPRKLLRGWSVLLVTRSSVPRLEAVSKLVAEVVKTFGTRRKPKLLTSSATKNRVLKPVLTSGDAANR